MLHLRCPSLALYLISSFLSVFCSIRPVAATPVTSLAIILNTIPAELIPAATVPSEPVRSRFPGVEPSKNLPPPPCDVSRVSFTTEARIEDPFYHLRKIVDYLQYCDLTREGWEGEEEERAGRVKRPLVSIVNFLAWNEDKSGWEEAYTKKYRSFERRTAQQHEEAFGSFSREEASDKGGLNIFQSTFEQSRHTELKFYDGFYAMVSAETNTAQYLRGVDLGRQIYTDKKVRLHEIIDPFTRETLSATCTRTTSNGTFEDPGESFRFEGNGKAKLIFSGTEYSYAKVIIYPVNPVTSSYTVEFSFGDRPSRRNIPVDPNLRMFEDEAFLRTALNLLQLKCSKEEIKFLFFS